VIPISIVFSSLISQAIVSPLLIIFLIKVNSFDINSYSPPTLVDIKTTRAALGERVITTPTVEWANAASCGRLDPTTKVFLKLELLQHGGSFKARGALNVMLTLTKEELVRGVTAVSAGNHAIAVAYAAKQVGTTAKVVMPETANTARVERCRALGAEVVFVPDVHAAFERAHAIEKEEGRTFVHPFEGPLVVQGTATVGLELCEAVADLDAVVVPIGGGGLCAGVATATKLLQPNCKVYGVEPEGADSMSRSFAAGEPTKIDEVKTIADSLGAPYALPYSYSLCRRYVDEVVKVSDDELRAAMRFVLEEFKLAVEPAGAASTAALLGPLLQHINGKRVALIMCGSNIDSETFRELIDIDQPNVPRDTRRGTYR